MPRRQGDTIGAVRRARILIELTIHVTKGPVNTKQVRATYGVGPQPARAILMELIELHNGGVVRVLPRSPFTVAARGHVR